MSGSYSFSSDYSYSYYTDEPDKKNPLVEACRRKDWSHARSLVGENNVDGVDSRKWTPLHMSLDAGQVDLAKRLIQKGANIDATTRTGWTPLLFACTREASVSVAPLLIRKGANVRTSSTSFWTALHAACQHGFAELIPQLIEAGADVNCLSKGKVTPLLVALREQHKQCALAILGSDTVDVNVPKKVRGDTALLVSLKHFGSDDLSIRIVDLGADVNVPDTDNCTPLLCACKGKRSGMARHLLRVRGIDVNKESKFCETPLAYAVLNGMATVERELRRMGAHDYAKENVHPLSPTAFPRSRFATANGLAVPTVHIDDIDSFSFFKRFVSKSVPVVIKGALKAWPAREAWTDDYLKRKVGSRSVMVDVSDTDVFTFYHNAWERRKMPLTSFLDLYADPEREQNYYIGAVNIPDELPELHKDIRRPPFAQVLNETDCLVWLGSGGQVTPVHLDDRENIMAVVSGRKHFKIWHPCMTNCLYARDSGVVGNYAVSSEIGDISSVDKEKFPRFADAEGLEVTLSAGDMFFLPAFWWHQVHSYDRNIAVNFWYTPHSELLDGMMDGVCANIEHVRPFPLPS